MNRQIRMLGIALLCCFGALFVRLNYVQVFGAQQLATNPLNTRPIIEDFGRARGDIITADGVVVATSVPDQTQLGRQRLYPQGELYAHITGWYSFNYGASGLERTRNDELAGRENPVPVGELLDLLAPEEVSADLHLSIRHDVQTAARDALGQRRGSVVVLDPQTGLVEALWSWPSYDPGPISSNDLPAAELAWIGLSADARNPALARSYREVYAPGSTFKLVTAGAALIDGAVGMEGPLFPPSAGYTPPLTESSIGNFAGTTCGGTLLDAIRESCNTTFALLAAELLGPDPMIDAAERVGFNQEIPFDLPDGAVSRFPEDFGAEVGRSQLDPDVALVERTPALAQSAIGQFDVRATPLQMALIAAGLANYGPMPEPAVTQRIIADSGDLVESHEAQTWLPGFGLGTIGVELRASMLAVVDSGTATGLQLPGLAVGAKTGTAQTTGTEGGDATEDTHAWVIAFAGPQDGPTTHAIAVIVEATPGGGQQTGGEVAVPIARAVLEVATTGP